jgi:transposase
MTKRTKHTQPTPRESAVAASWFAGIDVSCAELVLVVREAGRSGAAQRFENTPAGHARLIKCLAKYRGTGIVCLEATGVYSLDLALALADAGFALMVVNPKAAHHFAKALGRHSKSDGLDADMLAHYAERMPYVAWQRPSAEALDLRAYARRLQALTEDKARAKNQRHALTACAQVPQALLADVKLSIRQIEQRLASLRAAAVALIGAEAQLKARYRLLLSVKGIGSLSAIALLGELMLLPLALSNKQWVKHAGLDPRLFDSGSSVHKPARLSKSGNRYIRRALYMPALSAAQHDPHVRAYYQHLLAAGKKKMQGICAVMRKLLHALHGMLTHNQPWDNTRFYAIPAGLQN